MDGQRFDEVTKALAAGASRRAVLRTALGGMGAGLLALVGVTKASATDTLSCIDDCNQRFQPGLARGQCISTCATDTLSCIDNCEQRFEPGLALVQCISSCTTGDEDDEGGNGGGTPCGPTTCPEGQVCCNESCGICTPPGGSCIQIFCGDDGGEDPGPSLVACGGITGEACPEGFTCVDDPTDDCDPATGGADCLGVCQRTCQSDADCLDGDSDACTGAACEEGTCVYFIVTCAPGFVCCGNGECCARRG